jgi:2'-5' RNA ligase
MARGDDMAIAVVNYPTFAESDLTWIQSIRQKYDPLYFHIIDPHITLVFPTDAVAQQMLIEHVQKHVSSVVAFEVVFRCAILGDPEFQGHAHAFLIPDEGFSRVVDLHDRLYTGPLAGELRLDLPFIPHVGIANTPKPKECKVVVDRLNAMAFEVRGRVEQVDVIGYDGERVWTIERISLGSKHGKGA